MDELSFSDDQATGGFGGIGGEGKGGAIYNQGTATVTNSTLSDDQANSGAGGVSGGDGGALDYDVGTITVKGTILADSTGGNCNVTLTDNGYNISDDDTCGFSATGSADNGDSVNPLPAPAPQQPLCDTGAYEYGAVPHATPTRVYLYIDDNFIGYNSYSWNTTKFTNGSHYLLCNGYRNSALVGSAAESVTVRN
jgi:hypothetical protein